MAVPPIGMSQQNPMASPAMRYGIGLSGALLVAFVAYTYLDGTAQLAAYAVAVVDAVVTPWVLKQAMT